MDTAAASACAAPAGRPLDMECGPVCADAHAHGRAMAQTCGHLAHRGPAHGPGNLAPAARGRAPALPQGPCLGVPPTGRAAFVPCPAAARVDHEAATDCDGTVFSTVGNFATGIGQCVGRSCRWLAGQQKISTGQNAPVASVFHSFLCPVAAGVAARKPLSAQRATASAGSGPHCSRARLSRGGLVHAGAFRLFYPAGWRGLV